MPRGVRAGPPCLWHCFTAIAVLPAGGAPSVPGTVLLLSVSGTHLREVTFHAKHTDLVLSRASFWMLLKGCIDSE